METLNRKNAAFLAYIFIDMAVLFAVNFYYLDVSGILLYAILIVLSSSLIFFTKNIVAGFFNVRMTGKFWVSGLIFSAIATLAASSFGLPIPIPVINYNKYGRITTLKGIKKGEIKMHEKWEITFLSSSLILFAAFVFISMWHFLGQEAFLMTGIALAMFVLVDFLPEKKFNGANLIYHNSIMYLITFLFLLVIGILSIADYSASFAVFVAFMAFILVTYIIKLW